MVKFSKKGWNSDFDDKKFTGDQLERYTAGLRDDLYGRRDPVAKRGRTFHTHPQFSEAPRNFTPDEIFETMKEAAENGDVQRQYLVGLEYIKRGAHWMRKAAEKRWPDAVRDIAKLEEIDLV